VAERAEWPMESRTECRAWLFGLRNGPLLSGVNWCSCLDELKREEGVEQPDSATLAEARRLAGLRFPCAVS